MTVIFLVSFGKPGHIIAFYTCSFDTGIDLILSLCKFLKLIYITWGLNYFTNKVEVFVDLYIQFTQV